MLRHLWFSSGHSRYVFLFLFEIEDETLTINKVFGFFCSICQSSFLRSWTFSFMVSSVVFYHLFTGIFFINIIYSNKYIFIWIIITKEFKCNYFSLKLKIVTLWYCIYIKTKCWLNLIWIRHAFRYEGLIWSSSLYNQLAFHLVI